MTKQQRLLLSKITEPTLIMVYANETKEQSPVRFRILTPDGMSKWVYIRLGLEYWKSEDTFNIRLERQVSCFLYDISGEVTLNKTLGAMERYDARYKHKMIILGSV